MFRYIFSIKFSFAAYLFKLCFLGDPRPPVGRPKKRQFFERRIFSDANAEKMAFFRTPKNGAFLAPALSLRNTHAVSFRQQAWT